MESPGVIAIYSRKSRFTGKGESIENQVALCREYIRLHFGETDARNAAIYEDEGFSGGTLERPRFRKMMADTKAGAVRAIIVYRLDRISRNIGDFAALIEELNRRQIDFISIREQFDTSSPMGRAMMYITSVFSQLERETIAERIRDNMQELSKTGRWLGGVSPVGFRSVCMEKNDADGRRRRSFALKAVQEELRLVKTIYDVFLETGSLSQTEQHLKQAGILTRNGKAYTRFAIKAILQNPVYAAADTETFEYMKRQGANVFADVELIDGRHGILAYNRTVQHSGKRHMCNPISEWIVSIGMHEAVISGRRWIQAQNIFEDNRKKAGRKSRTGTALLSGLVRCSTCGGLMRPKLGRGLAPSGEPAFRYVCIAKEQSRRELCQGANCPGNELDQLVFDAIQVLAEDREEYRRILREHASRGKSRFCKLDETEEAEESAEEEISRAESFSDGLAAASLSQKRDALRSLVHCVVWDGETAHLYLSGSEDNWSGLKMKS